MIIILDHSKDILNYIPEIIGICGTLLGTILGWILHLISDNVEKIYIYVNDFQEQKSNQKEYAYIVKLFIYNASHKQQCLRNIRFSFTNGKKVLYSSEPNEENCSFDTLRGKDKRRDIIPIESYKQDELILSDLISEGNYNKLSDTRKIYMIYEDKKNRTKKKLIKSKFELDKVKNYNGEKFL